MINIPEGFYELVIKCKEYYGDSHLIDRKKINNEDIHNNAVFVVFLRLGGMLDEAQSNYLIEVVEKDDKLLDKEYILHTPFLKWSERLLKLIESEKKIEHNSTKLATLSIIRPSTNPEAPIKRLYDDLFNFLEYIKNKPFDKDLVNNSIPSKDKDAEIIGDIKKQVRGIAFTKATLFCYGIGIGFDFSAVSQHVKSFIKLFVKSYVDLNEDYYPINNKLEQIFLKKYQSKDSKILMRHIDLAIYALYVGRAQLFEKHGKSKVTPRMILDWIDFKKMNLDKFLEIIGNIDEIENYAQDFTDFMVARM